MGETRVDLQHLLEDLRDAFTGSLEETIVTEIVANCLDAGASNIAISVNPAAPAITIVDDGRGMQRRELSRYHDIAASTKRRGEGIGFAGVGIKLGLLVSREVLTETRRGATHVATSWSLASRYRAPWKWVPAPGLLLARGTAVRLTLTSPLSPLLDVGFIEEAIRRHFEPLMHPVFDEMIRRHYAHAVSIDLNGRRLSPSPTDIGDIVPIAIRLARKRTPSAVGYLARLPAAVQEDRSGIALSTFGKVIKRGWDWLGISPAAADRVTGLVEVPALAESLTLNKNDFIRTGARGATYLAYRKALQEVVLRQLTAWGESPPDPVMPRQSRLDRDLERVLEDLAGEFPLLHSLVERRRGGQKRLPISDSRAGDALASLTSLLTSREASQPDMRFVTRRDRSATRCGDTVNGFGCLSASASGTIDRRGGGTARIRRDASTHAIRPEHSLRGAPRRSGAGPVGGQHDLGERAAPRLPTSAGVALAGLSPGALGRAGVGATRGHAGGRASLRDAVSCRVGDGFRGQAQAP